MHIVLDDYLRSFGNECVFDASHKNVINFPKYMIIRWAEEPLTMNVVKAL